MQQIKTVIRPFYEINLFDTEINNLLNEGWNIKQRKIINVSGAPGDSFNIPVVQALYAELERFEPTRGLFRA